MNLFARRPSKPQPPVPIPGLLPLLGADERLAAHAESIERLADMAAVTQTHFDRYYRPVLAALAALVQGLPAPQRPQQTLLAVRLAAAQRALARRRAWLLPVGAEPERIAREADLWSYAVFTLALLKNLTRELAALEVDLIDSGGQVTGRWQPWQGPSDPAAVAGLRATVTEPGPVCDWTPLLATGLLPTAGTEWLWREGSVFEVWLAVLTGSGEVPEVIQDILEDSP